jgi:hypothetical protein
MKLLGEHDLKFSHFSREIDDPIRGNASGVRRRFWKFRCLICFSFISAHCQQLYPHFSLHVSKSMAKIIDHPPFSVCCVYYRDTAQCSLGSFSLTAGRRALAVIPNRSEWAVTSRVQCLAVNISFLLPYVNGKAMYV